jgi:hypothetical protein
MKAPTQLNVSISCGTLRTADLLSAFAAELEWLNDSPFDNRPHNLAGQIQDLFSDDGETIKEEKQDEAQWILEEAFDLLNEASPEGYYFGTHPGDGSDFGFWQIQD